MVVESRSWERRISVIVRGELLLLLFVMGGPIMAEWIRVRSQGSLVASVVSTFGTRLMGTIVLFGTFVHIFNLWVHGTPGQTTFWSRTLGLVAGLKSKPTHRAAAKSTAKCTHGRV